MSLCTLRIPFGTPTTKGCWPTIHARQVLVPERTDLIFMERY